jgi:hypothetical protein
LSPRLRLQKENFLILLYCNCFIIVFYALDLQLVWMNAICFINICYKLLFLVNIVSGNTPLYWFFVFFTCRLPYMRTSCFNCKMKNENINLLSSTWKRRILCLNCLMKSTTTNMHTQRKWDSLSCILFLRFLISFVGV